jgi:KDO2-lipid IV(A) lauroyltransferase
MGRAGDLAGDFVYHVLRTRRRVVLENLGATLGLALDRPGVERIARDVYRHLGRTLFEYGRFGDLRGPHLPDWLEVRGFEHLEAAYRRGRGVVVVTGHFGNWELLGAIISHHGLPVHFLAKEQRNPYVDRYMDRARSRHLAVGVLNPGPELRRIFRSLRRGEMIGMLFDQDAGSDGLFLDVLGRVASVQPGAAVFAHRTGALIVSCGVFRLPGGRHRACFEPAVEPDPRAPSAAEVRRLTECCEASLERYIYLRPEQYYWVHRRWKTRPPGESRGGSGG